MEAIPRVSCCLNSDAFAPEAAPEGREAFMDWFRKITKWGEEHDYDDPAYTSPKLRDWYGDMVSIFPAMNGPNGVADDHPSHDSGHVTDYTCARDAIYVGFSWNVAEEAYDHTLTYAAIHKVGFFDVSTPDGAVWLPSASGYRVVHGGTSADRDRERTLANLSDVLSDVHTWIYRRDASELPTRMLEAIKKVRGGAVGLMSAALQNNTSP